MQACGARGQRRLFGRIVAGSAGVALLVGVGAAPAIAQQAERAGGPLRYAGSSSKAVYFIVGPTNPPRSGTFVIWQWRFPRHPVGLVDASALQMVIDCRRNTRQITLIETYGKTGFRKAMPPSASAAATAVPTPKTTGAATQKEACEPYTFAKRLRINNYRRARAVVDRMEARKDLKNAAAVAAVPAGALPAGLDPMRCRAVAAVLADNYDKTIQMGKLLVAIGPSNGATDAELAKTRITIARNQAKRLRSAIVLTAFKAAPPANAMTVQQLRRTKVSELERDLHKCVGATSSPQRFRD